MSTNPLVNVIVPVYNEEPYLAECLCSLTHQTYSNLAIIVVDDGSTDGSRKIAEAIADKDPRVLILSQTNRGQGAARNAGLAVASGEYTCFVDADDWVDTDYIETLIKNIAKFDMLQTGYRRVKNDGTIVEQKPPIHRYRFTSPCMRLYKTAIIRQTGGFPCGMIYEDVIFSMRLWSLHPSYAQIKYIGYNYRLNPESTTSRPNLAAQHALFSAIHNIAVAWWLKAYTIIRLKMHFLFLGK